MFVDASGRRGRRVRQLCWAAGVLAGGYVLVVLVSLFTPDGLAPLNLPGLGRILPGPGAPVLPDEHGVRQPVGVLLSPRPSAVPTTDPTTATPRPGAASSTPQPTTLRRSPLPTSTPRTTASPVASATRPPRPTQAATPKPHPTPTPHGR